MSRKKIAPETWYEMKARHHRERIALVEGLRDQGLCQSQVARQLEMERTTLNNFIKRNGIYWHVNRQGQKINYEGKDR